MRIARRTGELSLEEDRDHILLSNGTIGLEFEKGTGFALCNVVNMVTGHSFLLPAAGKTLWRMDFRDAGGRSYYLANEAECSRSFRLDEEPGSYALLLEWRGLALGGLRDAVDVKVSVTLEEGSPLSHWRMRADNRSGEVCLWEAVFPVVSHVGATRGCPSEEALVVPEGWGRGYRNPGTMSGLDAVYPSGWNFAMQFLAFLHGDSGLYVAAHDPEAYHKRFTFIPDAYTGTEIGHIPRSTFQVANYPPGMGSIQRSYETPYDLVVGVFKGDWYEAAKIYRAWALENARWCRQGPLSRRRDLGQLKETAVWLLPPGESEGRLDLVVPKVLRFKEFLNAPLGLHWYNWHKVPFDTDYPEYFPVKEGFAEGVKRLREVGVRVMPYVNARLWDMNSRSWGEEGAERWCTKDSAPRLSPRTLQNHVEVYGSRQRFAVMCPYTASWQEKLAGVVDRLAREYGVDGVYLDQIAAAAANLCFDPGHGHPVGGGNYWVLGYESLLTKARESARDANQSFFITTECNAECYMGHVDALLMWHSLLGELVPLFPAVYGGWAITFGRTFTGEDLENPLSFAVKLAQMFILGAQLGWFSLYELLDEKHRAEAEYLRSLAAYRQLAKEFLVYGEMLRPPKPEIPLPTASLLWRFGDSTSRVEVPVVLSSAWRAEDGTLGLLFTNVSATPQTLAYTVDTVEYGLPIRRCYVVTRVSEDGPSRIGEYAGPRIPLRTVLPGRGVLLLEVEST